MPEIPEIETVRYHLENHTKGQKIKDVLVYRAKSINISAEEFSKALTGQRITSIRRRAKQIIIGTSNKHSLVIHFMLDGYARLFYPAEELNSRPSAVLVFESGEQVAFFKINLGYIHLVPTIELDSMAELAELGPEPLFEGFTLEKFIFMLQSRKGMIKPLLMDQKFIAGIGNVYSNEILFCSQILPTRKVTDITEDEQAKVYHCIKDILKQAIELGGVAEEKFSSNDNLTGGYTPYLRVAYRTGNPCYNCSQKIVTKRVGGRNAFYCPVCQK